MGRGLTWLDTRHGDSETHERRQLESHHGLYVSCDLLPPGNAADKFTSSSPNSSPARYMECVASIHPGCMTGILCSTAYCKFSSGASGASTRTQLKRSTRYLAEEKPDATTCVTVTVRADSIDAPSCLAILASSACHFQLWVAREEITAQESCVFKIEVYLVLDTCKGNHHRFPRPTTGPQCSRGCLVVWLVSYSSLPCNLWKVSYS